MMQSFTMQSSQMTAQMHARIASRCLQPHGVPRTVAPILRQVIELRFLVMRICETCHSLPQILKIDSVSCPAADSACQEESEHSHHQRRRSRR